MTVISVDLASRRYSDIGIAILRDKGSEIDVDLIPPSHLNLEGVPDAPLVATKLAMLAAKWDARLIILDGPQGWCGNKTGLTIMRRCEQITRAPGKMGLPGCVKPRTWTAMAVFSIALFDALHDRGYPRFEGHEWCGDRRSVESFPTHAWRMLENKPLPSKQKARSRIKLWADVLVDRYNVRWSPELPSHDELQAIVAGLAGVLMERHGPQSCAVDGLPPYLEDGFWREGFIVSPTAAAFRRLRYEI